MATVEQGSPAREVLNQPPPLEGYNVFAENRPLAESLRREGGDAFEERAHALGERAGTAEALERGRLANEYPPILRTHDRFGNRIDEVEFHPAWHELLKLSVQAGVHALPWREPVPGAQVGRAAMMLAMSGVESGTGCPLSMTYAGVPALRAQPELAEEWEPRLTSLEYDPRSMPAEDKRGSLMGMAMTERQGGSDVRANTTVARPLNGGGPGAEYELDGHKWFCSAPMCDVFLVLAQADSGMSCFLLPRWTPDGERNRFHLQRLKDKLGNRSNASSEVEFDGAWARLVGEEGRGVPTIIKMVNHTRLDCVLGSAGLMRAAVAQATHHAAHRAAFGKLLIDQPLMQNVLADLCVESEAATLTAMRLARAMDEDDPFRRLGLAVSKYWVCKSATWHVGEALECLGGNGYVELSGMPRLYREAPLNSIWEGSGNVNCLDVLRGMVRSPEAVDAFFGEVDSAGGAVADYTAGIKRELSDLDEIEFRARRIVESMALALQASLLVRHGDPAVADAFVATRLTGDHGRSLGTLPRGIDCERIVERHRPKLAA
ncbi:MAG: putative acyl-CoA dehydrogenase [Thermoleophilaceae bacterium]|jgi:putative acyl-CoA dehydrogenase|nr:putative acyl-CoA dehydrogenase [Thermoleophilaceae bacterium]